MTGSATVFPLRLTVNHHAQVRDYEKFAAALRKQTSLSPDLYDIPTLDELADEFDTLEEVRLTDPVPHRDSAKESAGTVVSRPFGTVNSVSRLLVTRSAHRPDLTDCPCVRARASRVPGDPLCFATVFFTAVLCAADESPESWPSFDLG